MSKPQQFEQHVLVSLGEGSLSLLAARSQKQFDCIDMSIFSTRFCHCPLLWRFEPPLLGGLSFTFASGFGRVCFPASFSPCTDHTKDLYRYPS